MSSEQQITANRLNAQKSTGPRTPEGKACVSLNARKHGLTGRDVVMPNERPEDYDAFREGLLNSLDPYGDLEGMLADRIVVDAWRLRRVPMLEAALSRRSYQAIRVKEASGEVAKFVTSMADRYKDAFKDEEVTDEVAYAVADRRLREETAQLEDISFKVVDALEAASVALANLGRHEATLSRSIQRNTPRTTTAPSGASRGVCARSSSPRRERRRRFFE